MKRKMVSTCCNMLVKPCITKDFIGDKKSSFIGTVYYICTKCNNPCNITIIKK